MISKKIFRCIAVVLLFTFGVGLIPANCISTATGFWAARAEAQAADKAAQPASDIITDNSGWIYRICADGYAEVLGHSDASADSLSIPYVLGGAWVVRIGKDAFSENANLKSLFVPGTITEIDDTAFAVQQELVLRAYNGASALSFANEKGFPAENLSEYDFFDDVLDLTEMKASQWSMQGALSMRIADPWARRIQPGTKLFVPPSAIHVNGLTAAVSSVAADGTGCTVMLRNLNFVDAVESYHAEDVPLYMDAANTVILADGFEVLPQAQSYGTESGIKLSLPVEFKIDFKTKKGLKITGTASISNQITASIDYGFFKLNYVEVAKSTTYGLDLKMDVGSEKLDSTPLIGDKELDSEHIDFAKVPAVSMGGFLSGYFKLSLNIKYDGSASINVSFSTAETYTYYPDTGISVQKSKSHAKPVIGAASKFSTKVEGSFVLTLGLGTVGIDFFSLSLSVGPEVEFKAEVALANWDGESLDIEADPSFKVVVSIGLDMSVKIGILNDIEKLPHLHTSLPIFNLKITILECYWDGAQKKLVDDISDLWLPNGAKACKVEFYTGTNQNISSQLVAEGGLVSLPETPQRDGYHLKGWMDVMGSGELWDFAADTVSEDILLYAVWEEGEAVDEPEYELTEEELNSLDYLTYSFVKVGITMNGKKYDGEYWITGYTGNPEHLSIPAFMPDGNPVWAINTGAFKNCKTLRSVRIADRVYVYEDAFRNCTALESVYFEGETNYAREYAFAGCTALKNIVFPEYFTFYNYSFMGCTALKYLDIPSTCSFYQGVFQDCTSLETLNIQNMSYINSAMDFVAGCTSLKKVYIHAEENFRLPERAFRECLSLESVRIEGGGKVSSLGEQVFLDCLALKELSIDCAFTSIPNYAFSNCNALESFDFPEGLTSIGDYAFSYCTSLQQIDLPDSLTNIGHGAFGNCTSLKSVRIPDGVTVLNRSVFGRCVNLKNVELHQNLSTIKEGAFADCSSLVSINIPSSVTSIGMYAFQNCTELTRINLPKGITTIADQTFQCCFSLKEIEIPETVTSIGWGAFWGVEMETMLIPESVLRIKDEAFAFAQIKNLYISEKTTRIDEEAFDSYPETLYTTPGSAAETYFKKLTPDNDWFGSFDIIYLADNLQKISFAPNGGTSVSPAYVETGALIPRPAAPVRINYSFTGWYVDEACTTLWDFESDKVKKTPLTLYAGWEYAPSGFVYSYDGKNCIIVDINDPVSALVIPERLNGIPVTGIGPNAIGTGVKSVVLPASVTQIDPQAFMMADSLESIVVAQGNTVFHATDGVLYSSDGTLVCCPRAKVANSFTPESGTIAIGEYAFYGCDSLQKLILSEGVTAIHNRGIYDCDHLTAISLPSSLESLGDFGIYACEGIETLTFKADASVGVGNFTGLADNLAIYGPVTAPGLCAFADEYLISYNLYDVTYVMDGEILAVIAARAGTIPGTAGSLDEGTRALAGWSVEANGTLWDFSRDLMPQADITLYAVWMYDFSYEEMENGIKLLKYHGNETHIMVPEFIADQAVVAIDTGCFDGHAGITLVGNRNSVTEAFALLANIPFEAIRYTLTFDSNGGTYAAPFSLCVAEHAVEPAIHRSNYTLTGWYRDKACTDPWDFEHDVMPAGDMTLYAGWEKIDSDIEDVEFDFVTGVDGLTITGYTGSKRTVTIPSKINNMAVVAIGDRAFAGDQTMFSVIIPDSIQTIGKSAFAQSRVSQVTMGTGVKKIGAHAFDGCGELRSLTLSEELDVIGAYALQDCVSLTSLVLPDGLAVIPEGLLSGCSRLHELSLPDALEAIGGSAFAGCGISTVDLGAYVSDIRPDAFANCSSLSAIRVSESNMYYRSTNGVLFNRDGSELICYPAGKADESYTLPVGVSTIGEGAMADSRVKKLTLNSEVTYIASEALRGCRNLLTISFPSNAKLIGIGESAFRGCVRLQVLELPASLEYIDSQAFKGCTLDAVTFASDVALGNEAFSAVDGLVFYGESGIEAEEYADEYGIRFIDPSTDIPVTGIEIPKALVLLPGETTHLQAKLIPENTTETNIVWTSSDASVAVVDETGRVSARFEGVTTITATAQNGSTASCILTITASQSRKMVLDIFQHTMVLGDTYTLTAVMQPEDATVTIEWISEDDTIASVEDGFVRSHRTGSTVITVQAANYTPATCEITVVAPEQMMNNFVLPNALVHISDEAFAGGAFASVVLPEGLQSIGSRAFADCAALRQIVIPSSVISIEADAFAGCTDLVIFCKAGSEAETFALSQGLLCAAE